MTRGPRNSFESVSGACQTVGVNLVDRMFPRRLGVSFRWMIGSALVNNLGDGIALAAGPLLVASQTHDPFLVSLAPTLNLLPTVLFGRGAGAIVDRVDRKVLLITMNLLRAGVLAALAVTIATGVVSIWVVLAAMFALGVSETVADITAQTVLPSLVDPDDLGIANARLQTTFITVNQLAGPPIGAFLFAAARWLPFSTTAVCFVLGAVLFARVVLTPVAEVHTSGKSMRHDIVDGIRWLWHHRAMRTLTLTIILFNVTFGAAWGVLVLWAQQRLGLDAVGFGALTTISALGGLLGTLLYGRLAARFSLGNIMRAGLIIETLTHLAFALTAHPWVAYIVMFLFGGHAFIWGTTSTTVRQRAVPAHLMGRVGAVYVVGMVGGIVLGDPIGGFLARHFGMTAPYWFAFVGSALLVVAIWRELVHIAVARADDA